MRKRIVPLAVGFICLFSACGLQTQTAEELLQQVRGYYLEIEACAGHCEIVADYGQRVYLYGIDFSWSKDNETTLVLTAPENVLGTTVRISSGETALEFDGTLLETGPLDASGLTPIDALPAFLRYTQEGFVASCSIENTESDSYLHITCTVPKANNTLRTEADLWFSADTYALLRGEICSNGQTVIQCDFSDFGAVLPQQS